MPSTMGLTAGVAIAGEEEGKVVEEEEEVV
jgi:hypothetical protein